MKWRPNVKENSWQGVLAGSMNSRPHQRTPPYQAKALRYTG